MKENEDRLGRRDFLKASAIVAATILVRPVAHIPPEQPDECIPQGVTPELQEFLASHEVRKGDIDRNVVLMTYDDFGNHERFNAILDTYQELGAKATFFVPGGYARDKIYLRYYSREIERIVAEGHALGCHGLIHEPLTVYKKDQLSKDIRQWLGLVSSIVPGYEVKYFRFPFGASDQDAREVFAEYGLQSVLWSLESGGTEERTLQNVLERVSAGDIVLSHTPRFYDAYYSRQIVESLLSSGYSLESVATGLKKEDCPSARLDPQECPNN